MSYNDGYTYPTVKKENTILDDVWAQPVVDTETACHSVSGFLSHEVLQTERSEQGHLHASNLHGSCFKTTIFIFSGHLCTEITHALIDTGASSSFISIAAARTAQLPISICKPMKFRTCNGYVEYNHCTTMLIAIGGVYKSIEAYVDYHPDSRNLILGEPVLETFDMQSNHNYGRKHETRWTVSQNEVGKRRKRFVLRADAAHGRSEIKIYDRQTGARKAEGMCETAKEVDSRQKCERANKILKKHAPHVKSEHRVKYEPYIRYEPYLKYESRAKYKPRVKYESHVKNEPRVKYEYGEDWDVFFD